MTDSATKQPARALFAGDAWAVYNFDAADNRYRRFLARGRPVFTRLIESIVLYARIVIPTQDFLSLTTLVGVLGQTSVIDLLENDRIRFVRVQGALSYVGNGGGLKSYSAFSNDGNPHAFSAPVDAAVTWAVNGLDLAAIDPRLISLAINATTQVQASSLIDDVRTETYNDILGSDVLRTTFALNDQDLDNLGGIEPNGVRIYGGPDGNWTGDAIDYLMLLSATNLELRLAQVCECDDSSSICPVGQVLKAKATRAIAADEAFSSFLDFREIADIPDIAEGVLQGQLHLTDLVTLTMRKDGLQFQEWFHENCRTDPKAVAREYINLLRDVPRIQGLPAKTLRFIAASLIGLPGIASGLAAGIVDSFFIERWLRGASPKFFVEELRQLAEDLRQGDA